MLGGTSTGVHLNIGGKVRAFQFEYIHEVSIRQMAYELLNSPALLALAKD